MLVHHHVEYWAQNHPGALAVDDWTFAELDRRANQVGHALRELGVPDGGRFAVLAKNCPEWLAIYYGAFKVGAIPVPLNYRLAPREWIHLVSDSGATVVIAQDQYVEAMDTVAAQLDKVESFVAIGGRSSWTSFDKLVEGQPTTKPEADLTPDHELYQMYTSGTTGLPKGAVITHRSANANVFQLAMPYPMLPGDDVLTVMPLYHAGAAIASMMQLARGGHLNLLADFDPATCVRMLDEQGIAIATFVPAMIQAMLVQVPDVAERSYEKLRLICYGASAIAEETLRRAIEVFGCDFIQAYGMTEATVGLSHLLAEDHRLAMSGRPELLLSCGRPLVFTDIRILDEDGNEAPVGAVGEIVARGPQLMKGYWNLPEATAKTLRDGWLHTGDAGYRDADGYLYVSDRIKDMIVSGGENIYPREVEAVIFEMPQVADCAVIGVPDERWGETVKAVVVVRDGAEATEAEVVAWCRERLAGFKCPRSVDFTAELPRNPSGKVLKTELRKPYWEGRDRNVG